MIDLRSSSASGPWRLYYNVSTPQMFIRSDLCEGELAIGVCGERGGSVIISLINVLDLQFRRMG
jgi:hypothetical protein